MRLAYTDEQEAMRRELREYYAKLLDPQTRQALHEDSQGPVFRRVVKQMAADGWLGVGWPKEYGGQGKSAIEQFIFFDETMRAGAPIPMLTINTVGPTIMHNGNDKQKDFFLPKILAGDIHFAIGYSEPGAGTDLANLRTRAVRDGDEYVINGQKLWTSLAATSDYVWLAVRTDPDAKKHRGLSIICVPLDTPGISMTPLRLVGESLIYAVHYDDVRVSADMLIGGENNGWRLITGQLNSERVSLCSPGMGDKALSEVTAWAKETKLPDGRRVIDQPWVQTNLAKAYAGFEFLRLINWKVAWQATQGGNVDVADASTIKVFGTEFYLDSVRLLMEVVGEPAYLKEDSPGAVLGSRLESMYRGVVILTFGGGVNEVQRDLIAAFGLGMPLAKR
jgi:alkylation response protein AidB-like acyl-CoA dehydrogenase